MTISVHVEIEAETEEEALILALQADKQGSIPSPSQYGDFGEVWETSGELDGEPFDLIMETVKP